MNGSQALFKALIDAELDTCFANSGISEMQTVRWEGPKAYEPFFAWKRTRPTDTRVASQAHI